MLERLRSMFKGAEPAGPPQEVKSFAVTDAILSQDKVTVEGDVWRITIDGERSIPLFELPVADTHKCMLTYRAKLMADELSGQAYLEMWCRLPGRGEFFPEGLNQPIAGTTDWAEYEIPFHLQDRQYPDLLKLNVFGKGRGTVWIKDIRVLKTPLR
jgi:hypothetical protein